MGLILQLAYNELLLFCNTLLYLDCASDFGYNNFPWEGWRPLGDGSLTASSTGASFYDFENNGGDCTNFISQCIFAGSGVMNYTPTFGWYYNSQYSRAPAWTGVQYLYNFLISNRSVGPYGKPSDESNCQTGDIIQLKLEGE